MSRILPWLAYAVAAWALAALLGPPASPPVVAPRSAPEAICRETDPVASNDNRPGWRRDGVLDRNGFVRWRTCQPGTLRLHLSGSAAAGRGALTQVAWNQQVLWEGVVDDERRIEVVIPGAGWILIGFHNDGSSGREDRNLWIREIQFAPSASS